MTALRLAQLRQHQQRLQREIARLPPDHPPHKRQSLRDALAFVSAAIQRLTTGEALTPPPRIRRSRVRAWSA